MTDTAILQGRADAPRTAYATATRATMVTVVAVLLACSAAAWWFTVRQAASMSEMVAGLGHVGTRIPNDMTAPLFLTMWVAMMVAMMFPTVAPIVLMHRTVAVRRGSGPAGTVAFVGGYLAAWSAAGLVPLAALLAFRSVTADAGEDRWLATIAGGIVIIAGAYQFTRWKAACLRACRSPLAFLTTHDFGSGATGALRAGISHGLFCLGCCWALMSVLVVVGLMNLMWMGVLSLVFLVEKSTARGAAVTRAVGTALIVLGIAIVIWPSILPPVSGATDMVTSTMEMGG